MSDDRKITKEWLLKVHQNVMNEAHIREKIVKENAELRDALEWVVEAFTQNDPQWHDVPCISKAREVLYK